MLASRVTAGAARARVVLLASRLRHGCARHGGGAMHGTCVCVGGHGLLRVRPGTRAAFALDERVPDARSGAR